MKEDLIFQRLYLGKPTPRIPQTAVLSQSYIEYRDFLRWYKKEIGLPESGAQTDIQFIQDHPRGIMFEQIVLLKGWENKRNILLLEDVLTRLGPPSPNISAVIVGFRRISGSEFAKSLKIEQSEIGAFLEEAKDSYAWKLSKHSYDKTSPKIADVERDSFCSNLDKPFPPLKS